MALRPKDIGAVEEERTEDRPEQRAKARGEESEAVQAVRQVVRRERTHVEAGKAGVGEDEGGQMNQIDTLNAGVRLE